MVAWDFHHLRNPRVIKAGVLTLVAVGISVGVGVTVSNHRRNGKGADAGAGGDFTNEYDAVEPRLGVTDHIDRIGDMGKEILARNDGYSDYPVDDDGNGVASVDGKDDDWSGGWNDDGWEKCWYPLPSFPADDYVSPSSKSGKTKGVLAGVAGLSKGGKSKGGSNSASGDIAKTDGKTKPAGSSKGGKSGGSNSPDSFEGEKTG